MWAVADFRKAHQVYSICACNNMYTTYRELALKTRVMILVPLVYLIVTNNTVGMFREESVVVHSCCDLTACNAPGEMRAGCQYL